MTYEEFRQILVLADFELQETLGRESYFVAEKILNALDTAAYKGQYKDDF